MSKPLPRKQRVLNRGYLYSRSADDIGDLSVTLMDLDSAIMFYFDNVIKPSVEENGENGFGYDPLFYVPTHDCTSAGLDPKTKNSISHRGQALTQLLQCWNSHH